MIWFTGDINLTDNAFDIGFGVGSGILKGLRPFDLIQKREEDIWIGNFEGVCADISELSGYKKDMFRLPVNCLESCGNLIDYYGVANNHVMEHGSQAYSQMTDALSRVCKGVFGSNEKRSVVFEHEGKSVALVGFSLRDDQLGYSPMYWNFPEYNEIEKEFVPIQDCDFKVAYIHWGVEFVDHPYHDQKRFAHWLIDVGFDMVVGMHPHVMQGYEVYRDKYIFYSLGNFVFDMAWEPTKYGLVVKVDVSNCDVGYDYVMINEQYSPQIVSEAEVPASWRMSALSKKIAANENIEPYIAEANKGLKSYRRANYRYMFRNLPKYNLKIIGSMLRDFIRRRF